MERDYRPEKGDGTGSNGSGIGAKVPKFFKIVSNQGVHRLRLPPEFTRRYGHNLADCVSLKVPNGLVWKVELIHSNREAWLHRGWQLFEEYYSIQLGHLLLFKYVGDSHFEVNIFDTTAAEIKYSYYDSLERDALMNLQVAKTESESDDSVVFLKEILAGKKNVRRKHQDVDGDSNPPPTWDNKRSMQEFDRLHSEKPRRSSRVEQNSSSPVKKERRIFLADSSPNYRSYIADEHGDRKQVLQQRARDGNERFKAYTGALVFMSEKPITRNLFSIVVMHPSYVSTRRSALNIPPAFAKEISPRNSSILLVSEGKTWLVRYARGKQGATLTTGWRKFTEDNDLKVGDACVFEASKRINLAWEVIIFRG